VIEPPSPSNLIFPLSAAPLAVTVPSNSTYPENGSEFAYSSLNSIVILPFVSIVYVPTTLPLEAYTEPVSLLRGLTPSGN
jgi:hypothetical protein